MDRPGQNTVSPSQNIMYFDPEQHVYQTRTFQVEQYPPFYQSNQNPGQQPLPFEVESTNPQQMQMVQQQETPPHQQHSIYQAHETAANQVPCPCSQIHDTENSNRARLPFHTISLNNANFTRADVSGSPAASAAPAMSYTTTSMPYQSFAEMSLPFGYTGHVPQGLRANATELPLPESRPSGYSVEGSFIEDSARTIDDGIGCIRNSDTDRHNRQLSYSGSRSSVSETRNRGTFRGESLGSHPGDNGYRVTKSSSMTRKRASLSHLSEEERRAVNLERNRTAAAKCRNKKKRQEDELVRQSRVFKEHNKGLHMDAEALWSSLSRLVEIALRQAELSRKGVCKCGIEPKMVAKYTPSFVQSLMRKETFINPKSKPAWERFENMERLEKKFNGVRSGEKEEEALDDMYDDDDDAEDEDTT